MALVVESTSYNSSAGTTVVITKPTGVEVGDLLLLLVPTATTQNKACTGFTNVYAEKYAGPGGSVFSGLQALYRVADSTDVSASNYTVTGGTTTEAMIGAMMRVSGWTESNPIYDYASGGFYSGGDGTFTKSSISLTSPTSQLLIMVMMSYDASNGDYYGDATNLTVTSADANPSWTELCNIKNVKTASGDTAKSLTVGYAIRTALSDITAFSFDYTEYDDQTTAGGYGGLLLLAFPQDQTGTNSLLSVSPTIFENGDVYVGTNGTNATHIVSPILQTQSGRATTRTNWQNEAKPTNDDWNNETT